MERAPDDGSYYVRGDVIWKAACKKRDDANGTTTYSLGFPACKATECVGEDGAQVIARALNAAVALLPAADRLLAILGNPQVNDPARDAIEELRAAVRAAKGGQP
jgi:hypothetical protein